MAYIFKVGEPPPPAKHIIKDLFARAEKEVPNEWVKVAEGIASRRRFSEFVNATPSGKYEYRSKVVDGRLDIWIRVNIYDDSRSHTAY